MKEKDIKFAAIYFKVSSKKWYSCCINLTNVTIFNVTNCFVIFYTVMFEIVHKAIIGVCV